MHSADSIVGSQLRSGGHASVVGITVWEQPHEARAGEGGGSQARGGDASEGEGDDWMHGIESIIGAPAGTLPSKNSSSHEVHILLRSAFQTINPGPNPLAVGSSPLSNLAFNSG